MNDDSFTEPEPLRCDDCGTLLDGFDCPACRAAAPRCIIVGCEHPAACELGVAGEWWPVCRGHSINKLVPRRSLRRAHKTQGAL